MIEDNPKKENKRKRQRQSSTILNVWTLGDDVPTTSGEAGTSYAGLFSPVSIFTKFSTYFQSRREFSYSRLFPDFPVAWEPCWMTEAFD